MIANIHLFSICVGCQWCFVAKGGHRHWLVVCWKGQLGGGRCTTKHFQKMQKQSCWISWWLVARCHGQIGQGQRPQVSHFICDQDLWPSLGLCHWSYSWWWWANNARHWCGYYYSNSWQHHWPRYASILEQNCYILFLLVWSPFLFVVFVLGQCMYVLFTWIQTLTKNI
jgi:hypothetical protein